MSTGSPGNPTITTLRAMNASVGQALAWRPRHTPHRLGHAGGAAPARKTVHRSWQTVPMAQITLRGNAINTVGELPAVGSPAPAFTLTGGDLG